MRTFSGDACLELLSNSTTLLSVSSQSIGRLITLLEDHSPDENLLAALITFRRKVEQLGDSPEVKVLRRMLRNVDT